MENDSRLEIKKGRDMSVDRLKEVDKIWQMAFTKTYSPMLENNGELGDFSKDTFFILYGKGKIISTGRLRPVNNVKFMNKSYKIQGIGDIVSVIKGKGYGKKIMMAMKDHLSEKREIGIGFCRKDNSEFYIKCGFGIAKNLVRSFVFTDDKGKLMEDSFDDDVIFSSKGNEMITNMINNPKEKVLVSQKPW